MGKDRHGANGKPIVLKVPVGTQVFDEDRETLIHDFTTLGENSCWPKAAMAASATHISRPPPIARRATPIRTGGRGALDLAAAETDRGRGPGRPAQRRQVDVPVQGQRRRKPKIADYPFTTLAFRNSCG